MIIIAINLSPTSTYLQTVPCASLLSFRFMVSPFTNCYYMHICIPNCNLAGRMMLLWCLFLGWPFDFELLIGILFLGKTTPLSQLSQLPVILWVMMGPHKFFQSTLACPLVKSLLRSHLDCQDNETLWVLFLALLGNTFLFLHLLGILQSLFPLFHNGLLALSVRVFCWCIHWDWAPQICDLVACVFLLV